jgi:large subunit ribosomal protein L13
VDKTFVIKGNPTSDWTLVDASGQTLGRLASNIAHLLLGKHKPTYTPGVAMGDHVVVINAKEIAANDTTVNDKVYRRHTGYPGGLKSVTYQTQMRTHPERIIRAAVWGMIPHTKVGRVLIKRLRVFAGPEHTHAGQDPKVVEL